MLALLLDDLELLEFYCQLYPWEYPYRWYEVPVTIYEWFSISEWERMFWLDEIGWY